MTRRPRPRFAGRGRGARPGLTLRPVAFLVLVAIVALAFVFEAPGPGASGAAPREVVLPPGAGVVKIADLLQRAGIIRWRAAFVAAAELTGAGPRLKAGEYQFRARTKLSAVLDAIARGAVVRRFVTVPEGLTSKAAADILDHAESLTGPTVLAPEGALLPETYEIRQGETRAHVIQRMEAAREALLTRLWASRAPALPYRTPGDAVIMASVVEKETAKPEERPRIAAIFVHRLEKGMRLESDPTTIYGLTGGAPLGHGLRVSELASKSPYNTYLVAGLPPAPIGNPGRASLEAALNPAKTDDLYFVADGTGGHVFAADYATHLRNVAHWRAVEQARAKVAP